MKKPTFYVVYAVIMLVIWFAISTILSIIFDTKIPTLVMYIVYGGFIATFKPIYRWLKSKMDPDYKAASSLRMSIDNYRKYREIYDEQMMCHRMGKTPPDRTAEISNMNEWRKYCNFISSHEGGISAMYEKYKQQEDKTTDQSTVNKKYLVLQIFMNLFMLIGIFVTVKYVYGVCTDQLDDYVYLEDDLDVIHTDRNCKEIHNRVSFLDSDINFDENAFFCNECVTPKQYRKLVSED